MSNQKKPKSTAVFSVRTDHRNIATIYKHYQKSGVLIDSYSSLIRMAIEDFATILVKNKLSDDFTLLEALEFCAPLRHQPTHARKLRRTLAEQIVVEDGAVTRRAKGFEDVSDDELEGLIGDALDEG